MFLWHFVKIFTSQNHVNRIEELGAIHKGRPENFNVFLPPPPWCGRPLWMTTYRPENFENTWFTVGQLNGRVLRHQTTLHQYGGHAHFFVQNEKNLKISMMAWIFHYQPIDNILGFSRQIVSAAKIKILPIRFKVKISMFHPNNYAMFILHRITGDTDRRKNEVKMTNNLSKNNTLNAN